MVDSSSRSWRALSAGVLLLVGCVDAAAPAATASGERGAPSRSSTSWRYEVAADRALRQLQVETCFEGPPPPKLAPVAGSPQDLLQSAAGPDGALPVDSNRIDLAGVPPGGCVRYVVDLARAARRARGGGRRHGTVLLSQASWLWRPAPLPKQPSARLRFVLPSDRMRALTPWPRRGNVHRLRRSTFRRHAHVALGRFQIRTIELPGGRLRVGYLGDVAPKRWKVVRAWLEQAGQAVAQLYGRFPVPDAAVMVVPMHAGNDPVLFGLVRRGGGPSVMLLLRAGVQREALIGEWVAVHELSHLAIPRMSRNGAWLSEGIATYYQEVLRVRQGLHSPLRAWRNIVDGFRRGRDDGGSGRPLAEESAAMRRTHAFHYVYWSGTAFALQADVRARMATGGRQSLDTAIEGLPQQPRVHGAAWSPRRLLRAFQRTTSCKVFTELGGRYAKRREFPEVKPLLRRLGVVRNAAGKIVLSDDAPAADVRKAIMRGHE